MGLWLFTAFTSNLTSRHALIEHFLKVCVLHDQVYWDPFSFVLTVDWKLWLLRFRKRNQRGIQEKEEMMCLRSENGGECPRATQGDFPQLLHIGYIYISLDHASHSNHITTWLVEILPRLTNTIFLPTQHIKKQRHYFADQVPCSQSCGFSSSHVWMWELDHKESWVLKNWCFWTLVLEKTLWDPPGLQGV